MHVFLALIDKVEAAEKLIGRFRQFGLGEPVVVRARSAAAVLSAEVPVFGGLKGLVLGADEDRVLALSFVPVTEPAEAQRLVTRVQLEMDADDPPMGRIFALPVIAASRTG
ncbi:MAG: hypothetical protein IRZ16_23490 [Myxococcaceae bacterium]|nr:hypothetical protein [Myxococcaceae bacterium]